MPAGKPCLRGGVNEFVVNILWNAKVFVNTSVMKGDFQRLSFVRKIINTRSCYGAGIHFQVLFIGFRGYAYQEMIS